MANELTNLGDIERVIALGDLSKLTPEQRANYYAEVCRSLSLNPLTKPFEYITLNGKLTLYARKDCTDQLRRVHGVSIDKPDIRFEGEWILVTVSASDKTGRTDSDIGVVNKKDMRGDFGNAVMKAVSKAKRRVTLSLCGLGMLDETEVETIPDARPGPAVHVEPPKQLPPARDNSQLVRDYQTAYANCPDMATFDAVSQQVVADRQNGVLTEADCRTLRDTAIACKDRLRGKQPAAQTAA